MTNSDLAAWLFPSAVPGDAIDRYLSDTFARLDRMLALLPLVEPARPHRARTDPEALVESLAYQAKVGVTGAVRSGIARWFGASESARFEQAVTELTASAAASRPTLMIGASPRAGDGNELRSRLRRQLALVARELHGVLSGAVHELHELDVTALARMFTALADDMLMSYRYIDLVRASWRDYVRWESPARDARTAILVSPARLRPFRN